ncbi:MAG: hypothetical protein VXZ72_02370 [Chlamydiota bacterium]|nr:hypothetical protein [Chlamydiota bacterium]
MFTKKIKVEWDLDGASLEEAGVTEIVEVPLYGFRGGRSVEDYLSYVYGWLVLDWHDLSDEAEVTTCTEQSHAVQGDA